MKFMIRSTNKGLDSYSIKSSTTIQYKKKIESIMETSLNYSTNG